MEKKEYMGQIKNVMLTVIGTLILAAGTAIFIVPFDLVAGGVSGLAIIITRLIPSELITIDLVVTVLTWALFLMGKSKNRR